MESASSRYWVPDGGRLQLLSCKFPDAWCRLWKDRPARCRELMHLHQNPNPEHRKNSGLAMQPCKSRRAALTIWPSEHLAKSWEACFVYLHTATTKIYTSIPCTRTSSAR